MLPSSAVGRYYHDQSNPDSLFQIDTMAELPYFDAMHHGPRGVSKVNDVVELLFGERGLGLVHFFNRVPGEGCAYSTPPHQDAACVPFTGGSMAAAVPSVLRARRL